jgi:hypothetical protein
MDTEKHSELLNESTEKIRENLSTLDPMFNDLGRNLEKISETLVKSCIVLNPEYIFSIFSFLRDKPFIQKPSEVMQALLMNLKKISSHSKQEFKIECDPLVPDVIHNKSELQTEQTFADVRELRAENEKLRLLLDNCNQFIGSLKEDSQILDSACSKQLKSLKINLASKSTLPSLARRDTDSHLSSINESQSLDLSFVGNKSEKSGNLKMVLSEDLNTRSSKEPLEVPSSHPCFISAQSSLNLAKLSSPLLPFKPFFSSFSNFQSTLTKKLRILTDQLTNLQIQVSDIKFQLHLKSTKDQNNELQVFQKYLQKVLQDKEELQDLCEELKNDKKNLENRLVKNAINLESQLKCKNEEISSKNEKILELESKYFSKIDSKMNSVIDSRLEQLIITNVSLQGEISALEGKNAKIKSKFLADESKCKSFTQDSEISGPSSDLFDCRTGKDQEIKDLREALQMVSERYERDKEIMLKDLEESRQDMEVQIFRLKQEKAYQESVCKDLLKHLQDLNSEKQLMEKELIWLRQVFDQRVQPEEAHSSIDLEISKSVEVAEKSQMYRQKTIQDTILEELTEISVDLKKKRKTDFNTFTIFELVRNTLAHMIKIQEVIETETSSNIFRETSRNLSDVVSKLKLKVRNIEEESIILNKRVDLTSFDRVNTEPSPRLDRGNNELLQYYKKQLQIEKAKVLEKKHVIQLHKEQTAFLKQNLRDLQFELGRVKQVDFEYIKSVFIAFLKNIPRLPSQAEAVLDQLSSLLNLSEYEKNSVCRLESSYVLINN